MYDIIKVAALYLQNGKLLVARSQDRDVFYAVGGKMESGETEEGCLRREVAEEIACQVLEAKKYGDFSGKTPSGQSLLMPCYLVSLRGKPEASNEIAELAWVGKDYTSQPLSEILIKQICPALERDGLIH